MFFLFMVFDANYVQILTEIRRLARSCAKHRMIHHASQICENCFCSKTESFLNIFFLDSKFETFFSRINLEYNYFIFLKTKVILMR